MIDKKGVSVMFVLGTMIFIIIPMETKVFQVGEKVAITDQQDILTASETRYRPSPFFWFRRSLKEGGTVDEDYYAGGKNNNGGGQYSAADDDNGRSSSYSYAAVGGGWGR